MSGLDPLRPTRERPRPPSLVAHLQRHRRAASNLFLTIVTDPARLIPLGLLAVIGIGIALLALPIATAPAADGGPTGGNPIRVSAFTATSAVCVTGLVIVDTPSYWSTTGHVILLVLFQVGGLGIATLSSLVAFTVLRRWGLRSLLAAQQETRGDIGTVRTLVPRILATTAVIEGTTAAVLALRFATHYEMPPHQALWHGVFHGVSAFNNAGFALYSDSLMRYADDVWVIGPVMVAVILGGLGFPVLVELARFRHPRWWSVHTRLVLATSAVLVVAGALVLGALEWGSPTLRGMDGPTRVLSSLFMSVAARSVGFSTVDYANLGEAARLVTEGLMFIGAGSAGTSGGIKVGTLAVLILAAVAETRGDHDVHVFHRRIATGTVRQALVVLGISTVLTGVAIVVLLQTTPFELSDVIFEAVSATAVVGLSTGITASLPHGAQWFLVVAMFVGRVGPVAVAAAVAGTERKRLYRYPVARPLIG